MDYKLSEEFEFKVGMHQGSVLSLFLFAVLVDFVTKFPRDGALSELLYVSDLVPISETSKALRNKFLKWKEAFESQGLKGNLGKTKLMFSDGITKEFLSKSNYDPCLVCYLRAKANSVLCAVW